MNFALLIGSLAASLSAQMRVVPIAQGWAKSQINAVIFRKNSVTSSNGVQHAAFYDPDSKVRRAEKLRFSAWQETILSGCAAWIKSLA